MKPASLARTRLATGHYVSLAEHPRYGMALHQGADEAKDQSYFLALTPISRLKNAVFPLARVRKGEVRAALAEWGLSWFPFLARARKSVLCPTTITAPSSRGSACVFRRRADGPARRACRRQARRPLAVYRGAAPWAWRIVDGAAVRHRKGSFPQRAAAWGPADELPVNACAAGELNFLVPPELWPHELRVRTRYRQKAVPADIRLVGGGESGMDATARMLIRFHQPQLPSAPGQLAAVFDEHGHVLAGGIICKER